MVTFRPFAHLALNLYAIHALTPKLLKVHICRDDSTPRLLIVQFNPSEHSQIATFAPKVSDFQQLPSNVAQNFQ